MPPRSTDPTCQLSLRAFGFGSGIRSWPAFRSGTALQGALGCKSSLCAVCSKLVFLPCQDMELVLDCKIGLGVDNCPGVGILVWESGEELFEEPLICKYMLEAFVSYYNPHSCCLEKDPYILDFGIPWELEHCDLCNVLSGSLWLDLAIFLI